MMMKPRLQLFALAVNEVGGFWKSVVEPSLDPAEERDFISQQVHADQNGEDALTGRDEHNQPGDDTKPSGGVLEHQLGMPVPDEPFHRGFPV